MYQSPWYKFYKFYGFVPVHVELPKHVSFLLKASSVGFNLNLYIGMIMESNTGYIIHPAVTIETIIVAVTQLKNSGDIELPKRGCC
jgi:hypothetical protein